MQSDPRTEAFASLLKSGCTIDSENWTEADTRSKFIDTVLLDCLGWNEPDIHREHQRDGRRFDYRLSITRPRMIVEAKRASLDLPTAEKPSSIRIKIASLLKANPSLTEHFDQLQAYCAQWSVPLGVLTNGSRYFVLLASRTDGTPWKDGHVVIFPDIFDGSLDFAEFYGLLSRDAILEDRPYAALLTSGPPSPPRTPLSRMTDPDRRVQPNPLAIPLESVLHRVFSDATQEDSTEVLRNCYVYPAENVMRDPDAEALLDDSAPSYAQNTITVSSRSTFDQFLKTIEHYVNPDAGAQLLLLIGGLGVGKTMFLKRFFLLNLVGSSTKSSPNDTIGLYIDFRRPGLDPARIPDLVYTQLRKQIEELDGRPIPGRTSETFDLLSLDGLQQIFWSQYRRFQKAEGDLKSIDPKEYAKTRTGFLTRLRDDDEQFVTSAIRVLRSRYHCRLAVIIDNADQCASDYQHAAYLFARTLERDFSCLIVLSLREEWYWFHAIRSGGPLTAYHNVVFHIPSPRVRQVLAKRLDYALSLIHGYRIPPLWFGNILLEPVHIKEYLELCREAFFDNEPITVFYECLSNGSVRRGLEAFLTFVRAGGATTHDYFLALLSKKKPPMEFEHVFSPIASNQYAYYSEQRSTIPNIFRPVAASPNHLSYMMCAYTLRWFVDRAHAPAPPGPGYVPIAEVTSALRSMGVENDMVLQELGTLVARGLLVSDISLDQEQQNWKYLKITPWGAYLVSRLATRFLYQEVVMLDTPIGDTTLRDTIAAIYDHEGNVPAAQRYKAVTGFVEYLRRAEQRERARFSAQDIILFPAYIPWVEDLSQADYTQMRQQFLS